MRTRLVRSSCAALALITVAAISAVAQTSTTVILARHAEKAAYRAGDHRRARLVRATYGAASSVETCSAMK